MPTKFSVGDLVQVDILPQQSNTSIWKKSAEGTHLGIVVDIVDSPTPFFSECLTIKVSNGDVLTLSPNLVSSIND